MERSDQHNQKNAKRIRVQGMHCASCVARVEKAIKAVPGVKNAEVNLLMEEATVYGEAPRGDVAAAIRDAGYEAEEDDEDDEVEDKVEVEVEKEEAADPGLNKVDGGASKRDSAPDTGSEDESDPSLATAGDEGPAIVWLEIQGMFCASCVGRVEKELLKVEGVSDAEINLITGEARAVFTGSDTGLLVDAVKKAGYDADVKKGSGQDKQTPGDTTHDSDTRAVPEAPAESNRTTGLSFRRRFLIALPLGILVLLMEMLPMLIDPMHHFVQANRFGWNLAVLAITSVILFYPGAPFFTGAWKMARRFTADMNTLVAVGTGAAWVFSAYATFFGTDGGLVTPNDVYFDTAAVIIALILLGRWMEERAKHQTRGAIESLLELTPKMAHRLEAVNNSSSGGSGRYETKNSDASSDGVSGGFSEVDVDVVADADADGEKRLPDEDNKTGKPTEDGGLHNSNSMKLETVPVSKISRGDLLLVKSYEQVPVDGEVVEGEPLLDESMMTGESVPVPKSAGDGVTGGTLNTSESFRMRATRVGSETALAGIIETVRRAQSSKAPIQRLVDKVASVFVPIVLVIAVITLSVWIATGTLQEGIVNMVAVLLIACPCALGLATPTGIMVGSGRAAEKGILIKDAVSLEEARNISVVLFDKTGTLTEGKMQVTDVHLTGGKSEEDLLMLAAAVEQETDHPIAQAIVNRASEMPGLAIPAAASVKTRRGIGVTGMVGTTEVAIAAYDKSDLDDAGRAGIIGSFEQKGATVLSVTVDDTHAGYLAVADTIRKDAARVIDDLKSMGIQTVMVTGDRERPARAVAEALGIDQVEFEVKPDEKAATVKKYRTEGRHVAMAGDGINDAAALVEADLGIAMSTGADLAMSSADITILGGDLTRIPEAIRFSRRVLRVIRQNLFWAFVYNTVGIPLAAIGLLSPMFAAAAMALSSVSVVANSLRIKRF